MKSSRSYQEEYRNRQFYNDKIRLGISKNIKLHDQIENPLSSATTCLNVMGYLNQNPEKIIPFFKDFGLMIENILPFPKGADLSGEVYDDDGPIVFEWIGPKPSPLDEINGSRGQNRTSVDAFFIAKIDRKVSQVFIEWKFTESYPSGKPLHNFGGLRGIERLRRYSTVLAKQRGQLFPFKFKSEDSIGIQDFSYEPFYQLLRMTLLAKETTPIDIGCIHIEDYHILHLVHSENNDLLIVQPKHLKYCPGIASSGITDIHDLWISLLSEHEKKHFHYGYWDKAIRLLNDQTKYLEERYM